MTHSLAIILATFLVLSGVESRPQVIFKIVPDPTTSGLSTTLPSTSTEDNRDLFRIKFKTFVSKLSRILESMDMDNEIDDHIYISVHPSSEGEITKPHKIHSRLMRHHVDAKPQNPEEELSPVAKETQSSPPAFTMA